MKRLNFCQDWKFIKEDGSSRMLNLPHDAMIEELRNPGNPSGSAGSFFPGGIYTYEKMFNIPADWSGKHIVLQFEGVYKNARVYVNGKEAGGAAYGYTPFFVILNGLLNDGVANQIKVVAQNNDQPNSRWYTGSGIYRPVWAWVGEDAHVEPEGIKITTLSYSPSIIQVDVSHIGGTPSVEILDGDRLIASGEGSSVTMEILDAILWSADTPHLYTCRVILCDNGAVVDEATDTFGIRLVEWNPNGLFVNGVSTLLRGACVHHDNGILGARCYAVSEDRRVRILKKAGYNAIRSSHNPTSKAMLEACDRHGMYMIDETWDMWYSRKNKNDYAANFMENYRFDILAMVNRDFNHPSVIMYSICNEVSEPKDEKGLNVARDMVEYIHSLDKNRAVTGGVNLFIIDKAAKGKGIYKENGGLSDEMEGDKPNIASSLMFNIIATQVGTNMNKMANSSTADKNTAPFLDMLDLAGYNYASGRYPLEGKLHPNRVIYGSETFTQDIAKNWEMVKKYPYLVGDFMWTGWDYLGEAGMGAWNYHGEGGFEKKYPWILANGGAIDILGNIGAEAVFAAVVWGLRKKPYIGVRPVNHPGARVTKAVWGGTDAMESWAWKNCDGNKAIVEVYSDAYKVELLLNGKSQGKKKPKAYKAIYRTKYAEGELIAIAYDQGGGEISRTNLRSANGKASISIEPEKDNVRPGEIFYVDVYIKGENGVVESNADAMLTIAVEGGELLAFGSANPRTEESYLSCSFTTYYGRAQAVILAKDAGEILIKIDGEGLIAATATLPVINIDLNPVLWTV